MVYAFSSVLLVICLIVIFKDIILCFLFYFNHKQKSSQHLTRFPMVSILVAARNEERVIERCLESLSNQNYPADKYEILVGNDRSEDKTLEILKKLELKIKNLRVFNIDNVIVEKAGKMNVLAHLGKLAQGELLLFTDADTRVPQNWIQDLSIELLSGRGLVTGVTLLDQKSTFGRLQGLEWIHAITMMKVVSDLNIPVSTIGNNMGVTREAFDSVEGFSGIPYSVTEDHEIFKQITGKGYVNFHIFDRSVLAFSIPSSSFWELLLQRKRWMLGAFQLPLTFLTLLVLNSVYYLAIVLLFFIVPAYGVSIFLFRILLQGILIKLAFNRLGEKVMWKEIFMYEFYSGVLNLGALLIFLLPVKIKWKNRQY